MSKGGVTGKMADTFPVDKNDTNKEDSDTMEEVNEALKSCSFGWFHIKLLCASFFAYMNGLAISSTAPYILPNAECDLEMNLFEKGVLNAAPFIGMLLSSVLAGFLTDAFGRKAFLVYGYAGITFFTIFSSISQSFTMLISGKFFEGVLFAIAFSPAMTYTSEFCHNGIRDRVLVLQSSFMALGAIILAFIAWGVLPLNFNMSFFDGKLVLHSWSFFLMMSALWPCGALAFYCFLPETPKYLLTQHKYDEARAILVKMYVQNTGKPEDTYPHKDLWKGKTQRINSNPNLTAMDKFKRTLVAGLHNCKPMFQKPLLFYLILICFMNFIIMLLYNVIRLWFPQLSTIVEHYRTENSSDLCVMLDSYTDDQKMLLVNVNVTADEVCKPAISGTETYINSIILGAVCILSYIINGIFVNKLGKKFLIMFSGIVTVGCTLYIRWSGTKTEIVSLFATDQAIAQSMMGLLQLTTIEVFPTTTRTFAISMMMTFGRIGTLAGNIVFPILLDIGCSVPFFSLAGIMLFVTFLSLFLPKKSSS